MDKEQIIKGVVWLFPIIFTAGGLLWSLNNTSESVRHLGVEFDSHEKLEAHPVSGAQLEDHRVVLETIIVEQRGMRAEQTSQAVNIAAICQATGAVCR